MNWKQMTVIFIGIVFVAITVWDVLAISHGGTEASISSTFIMWSYKFPAFTFLFGFVCGHLMWRMKSNDDTKTIEGKNGDSKT